MMKTFDLFKICKKNFSIRKYIKPTYNQEYYNAIHSQRYKDKKKAIKSTPGQAIFASNPLYPDKTKSLGFHDEQNEHFMHLFYKRQKELEDRAASHIKIAKTARESKKGKSIYSSNISGVDTSDAGIEAMKVDEESGLIYGLGYDNYIRRSTKTAKDIDGDSVNKLNELVTKLGYLDLRDFVALNKYLIEAKNHENNVNKTKAKFLAIAMQRLSESKKEEVKKHFKNIEDKNPDAKSKEEKENLKIEFLFDNIQGSKELFYKHYYKLKEINERADNQALDEFEKYEKMVESLNKSNAITHDKDKYFNDNNKNKFYDMNDYMERIIKTYRDERTIQLKTNSYEIIQKMKDYIRRKENDKFLNDQSATDSLIKLAKYETFLNKYKRVYTPTNMETERLINNYLREKRIKEFTKEKMMEESDPYFSPLTEEDIDERLSRISDESERKKLLERHRLKEKYFDAKYEYRLQKLKDNIDQELADQLGIVIANETMKKKMNEHLTYYDTQINQPMANRNGFIDKLLDDHYSSFKLDYMYNYLDFFSNKYKVRKRISEELQRKISINEINYILNNLASEDSAKRNINTKKPIKYDVSQYVKTTFGTVMPTYLEMAAKGVSNNPNKDRERMATVESAIKTVEKETVELSENDKFEMELYKGIKNDPYYKHYLHTSLSYFAETMSDTVSGMPYLLKGFKLKDYMKYQKLTDSFKKSSNQITPLTNQEIADKRTEMIESLNSSVYMSSTEKLKEEPKKNVSVYGRGKRKRAVALAELKPGIGNITVNGFEFHRYFSHPTTRGKILWPLELTDTVCLYDIRLNIQGGGSTGQADAAIPAISKALIKINPEWRPILAKNLCLKHDPRNVEPKKPGRIKARKGYVYNRR